MTIKVMIKRKVKDDLAPSLDILLRQLRSLTVNQKGYISGESLKRVDEEEMSLVISSWKTLDDWRRWTANPDRIELQNEIDVMLGEQTEYEVYETV